MSTAARLRGARALAVGVLIAPLFVAGAARAEEQGPNPFACRGEALAIRSGLSQSQLKIERDKRVSEPAPPGETPIARAHRLCIVAELMSRLGDERAPDYYKEAIAANPDEGGYELWYGNYLGGVRGPRYPLLESAETHLYRAIAKIHKRRDAGKAREFDASTEEWADRRLLDLYQADGVPILPWKGYRYSGSGEDAPGLSLTAQGRMSKDTNDFVDVSDVRKFTSETVFASSVERLNRDLTREEKRTIVRAPPRYEVFARARVRQKYIGALDASYRSLWIQEGQIIRFDQPTILGNARVEEYGLGWKKPLSLYPLFDVMLDVSYRRVDRKGIVEFFPDQVEHIDLVEAKPAISRFIGMDKVTLGMNWVHMAMPDIVGGRIDQRKRGRQITAFYFDYAIYRPLLLPTISSGGVMWRRKETRGFHFFGGAAFDDEVFGTRLVQRRDYYGGTSLLGLGPWDFTVQGTVFTGGVTDAAGVDLSSLDNAQYRTTLVGLYRLIDNDVTPGLPKGASPAFLNLVIPVRHDIALTGPKDYESVRVGAELWSRFIATWLHGTSVLASGGYAYQYFYQLDKGLHVARADIGIGW